MGFEVARVRGHDCEDLRPGACERAALQDGEVYLYACRMTNAQQYRAQAAAQRALADASDLPNRRQLLERSAVMWDEMAQLAEDTIERSLINAASKASAGS